MKTPTAPQSSPLPWKADRDSKGVYVHWSDGCGIQTVIARVPDYKDAALIVRRVNSGHAFDAMRNALLLAAATLYRISLDGGPDFDADDMAHEAAKAYASIDSAFALVKEVPK